MPELKLYFKKFKIQFYFYTVLNLLFLDGEISQFKKRIILD